MARPRRLPDGKWGGRPDGPPHPDGRRKQIRVAEDTRPAAAAKFHEIEGLRLAHKKAAGRGPTLLTFGRRWIDHHLPNVAATTARRYRGIFDNHIAADPIGSLRLGDLTAQDGREWLARMRKKPGRSTGKLSNRSLQQNLVVLNLILQTAVAWGELDSNPFAAVERPRVRKDSARIKCWQLSEADRFRRAIARSDAPNAAIWLAAVDFTLLTGLRRGELAGLRWSDVDLAGNQLTIRHNRLSPGLITSAPKSAASNRTIPLSPEAGICLASLKAIQADDRAVFGSSWEDTGFVLVLPDGRPPSPDSISQRFRRDCERAGVRYVTFHGLRHTFATFALTNKVPLHVVTRLLGHASEAITLAEYAHSLPGSTVDAVEAVANYVFANDPERPERPAS